jgi:NAD(P)-dependent dehydrogenase (short-subunit alcohol dehydrogenase family)
MGAIDGKVAILAGGGRGIGAAVARLFAAEGAAVIVSDGETRDAAAGQHLVKAAVSEFGRLDIVVNMVAVPGEEEARGSREADWDAVIRTHLGGHYSVMRAACAYWREQRNPAAHYRIINLAPSAESSRQPGLAAVAMGIIGLTCSLAKGLVGYGVTANVISQGAADNVGSAVLYLASERSDGLTGRVIQAHCYALDTYQRSPRKGST